MASATQSDRAATDSERRPWAPVLRAATVAALCVVILASIIGKLTAGWSASRTGGSGVLDSAAYGALVGGVVSTALLAIEGETRRHGTGGGGDRRTPLHVGPLRLGWRLGPALVAGAAVGGGAAWVGWLLEVRRGSVGALVLFLLGSIAFGATVGAASRAASGDASGVHQGATSAAVGGAIGGFGVWLAANALHGMVAPTTNFTSWRALAEDPAAAERLVRHGIGAALPALLVPLGVASVDELRRAWRR